MAKSKKSHKHRSIHPAQHQPSDELIAHFETAEQLFASGNFVDAREIYRSLLATDKLFTPALRQLGLCELRLNETKMAIKHLSKYLKSVPEDQQGHAYIGQAYLMEGLSAKAKQSVAQALRMGQTADLHFLAASIEEQLRLPEKAIAHYEQGLILDTDRTSASLALGVVHKNLGNYKRAISIFDTILDTHPSHQSALSNLGSVYHAVGAYETAIEYYIKAQSFEPNANIAYNEGLSYQQLSDPVQSLRAFKRALTHAPEHVDAKIQIAESLSTQGLFADATQMLDDVISTNAHHPMAWYLKTQYQKFTQENTHIEKQISALCKQVKATDDISLAHFGLAKIYDDTKRYKLAFHHLFIANSQKAKSFKAAAERQITDLAKPLLELNREVSSDITQEGGQHDPIFIIGMPRSGTTLLERIVCNSPSISSCGEVDYFGPALFRRDNELGEYRDSGSIGKLTTSDLLLLRRGYLKRVSTLAGNAPRFVDKTPDNFHLVEMLRLIFPNAKFIHCTRHPLDTCLSIYFQLFQNLPYSYDLKNIAAYYLKYRTIVDQQRQRFEEKWLDIAYEDIVTDSSKLISKLSKFLDCEIMPLGESENPSQTSINTMSRWQARQKIYQGSMGRWEFYNENLTELKIALSAIL